MAIVRVYLNKDSSVTLDYNILKHMVEAYQSVLEYCGTHDPQCILTLEYPEHFKVTIAPKRI